MVNTTLRIRRLDGGLLVIEGGALSEAFFGYDAEYDAAAGQTTLDTIETSDINLLNKTMRTRSSSALWAAFCGRRLDWLAAIPTDLDLLRAGDQRWERTGGDELVGGAFAALVGKGRGPAVVTKLLHLKRPLLFPILDRLVVEVLGAHIAPGTSAAAQATDVVLHLREQGRPNVAALRQIQQRLRQEGKERSLLRILDWVLYTSHPAAGGPTAAGRIIEIRSADASSSAT